MYLLQVFFLTDGPSRMWKKSASGVLASLRGSPYAQSTIRLFARCGLALGQGASRRARVGG
ncbi:MAG: hypothetical protein K0S45_1877 [Nitrospira sp.]|jgi:hypothetical protein|nr:hypothetical protein [Nitrospira sp.]